jgi:serine/threonine-protein kinase
LSEPLQCPKCAKVLTDETNFCPACGEDLRGLTPTADTLSVPWAGKVIDGRYRLREKLGEGGMGAVYKVEHVRIGKILALKVLRPDLQRDKRVVSRFHQEARLVSKLSHPNTIQVFDFGELEDGSLYIAMEYLAGRDLAWTLRAHGPMDEERAVHIGIQVLSSLAEAHEHGIVHRDVKPANVMVVKGKRGTRQELVKVLDFGIAKLNEGEGRKHITGVTDFVGTPAYMSPEQASGEELDARSDLYSVGAMLFELVTGRGPFLGPNPMAIVNQHLTEPAPRLSQVAPEKDFSPAFEAVVARALAKNRKDRFDGADAMREALEEAARALGAQSASTYTPLPDETMDVVRRADFDRFERSLRLRRALAPVGVVLLLAGAGVIGQRLWQEQASAVVTAEREDNDDPSRANRIGLGTEVEGHVGAPVSGKASDRDLYVLELPAPAVLAAELSAVPDLNLVLELTHLDADGKRTRILLDDAPTGQPERVDGVRLGPGRLFARVEERHYFTEAPRPPRESSRNAYRLRVSEVPDAGAAGAALEVEPDDAVDAATKVTVAQPVTGFAGAALPHETLLLQQELSTADFYVLDEPAEGAVSALVVPPAEGRLAVLDADEFERWREQMRSAVANPPVPPASVAAGKPVLVALQGERRAVRIQPEPPTAPGSAYRVAFVTGRPGGLSGALELARALDAGGRREDASEVLRLVAAAFAESPQLPELRAALGQPAPATP